MRHTRVTDVDGLLPALAAPGPGLSVVEVRVDRAGRRALGERIADEVAAAVGAALPGLTDPSETRRRTPRFCEGSLQRRRV